MDFLLKDPIKCHGRLGGSVTTATKTKCLPKKPIWQKKLKKEFNHQIHLNTIPKKQTLFWVSSSGSSRDNKAQSRPVGMDINPSLPKLSRGESRSRIPHKHQGASGNHGKRKWQTMANRDGHGDRAGSTFGAIRKEKQKAPVPWPIPLKFPFASYSRLDPAPVRFPGEARQPIPCDITPKLGCFLLPC